MNDLRKAAEMALEALGRSHPISNSDKHLYAHSEAMAALIQALATEEALDRMVAENQKLGLYDEYLQPSIEKGTDFSGALKPPLTCLETPDIVDLDKYVSVTYKSPFGASVYDVDGVKWLIDNHGADYFKSQEWQDKCARSETHDRPT